MAPGGLGGGGQTRSWSEMMGRIEGTVWTRGPCVVVDDDYDDDDDSDALSDAEVVGFLIGIRPETGV